MAVSATGIKQYKPPVPGRAGALYPAAPAPTTQPLPRQQSGIGGYTGSTGGSVQPRPQITTYRWQTPALTASQQAAIAAGGGAGGGGGGGGGYEAQEGPDLEALKEQELSATMAAIKAKYQQARAGLRNEKELLTLSNQASRAQSIRSEAAQDEALLNRFGGAGTARSGFAAQARAANATEMGLARAAATAEYRAQKGYIMQQLKQGLITQREAEEAQAIAAIETAFAMHALNQPL